MFGEEVINESNKYLLHLSSGRGGAGKGLRSTGLALQLAYPEWGRYPEPL